MDKIHEPTVTDRGIYASEAGTGETISEKRGSTRDAEDMRRLGRVQELRVSDKYPQRRAVVTVRATAKLRISVHLRLCHDFDEHVASAAPVSSIDTYILEHIADNF